MPHPIGLYVHVPFCRSKCGYCNFYSEVNDSSRAAYVETVCREIRSYAGQGITADTLYFGGGTPSVLRAFEIAAIVSACRESFSLSGEWTIECNPDSADAQLLRELKALGFNRLSFGVQSMVDHELKLLGRRHDRETAERAVKAAREAGFTNISLDLMLGIPDQTEETLMETLRRITAVRPEHISAYLLKIEADTPFDRAEIRSRCADEDVSADRYLSVSSYLKEAGYDHYEISNFALPGFESRHNSRYWRCGEYLGFGPAAHSFFMGRRSYHPPKLSDYIRSGGENRIDDGAGGDPEERLMLGLRLREGITPAQCGFSPQEGEKLLKKARPLEQAGLLTVTEDRIALTADGFLLSNSIIATLL